MSPKKETIKNELDQTNELLSKIEDVMKKDSKDRKKILKDVEKDMESHSKRMVEYDRTAKAYKLLEVKYNTLASEVEQIKKSADNTIEALKANLENSENENKLLKKMIMSQKRKISGLQSIVELIVNDYGIQNVELVTGLSSDKIKEYFQE